MGVGNHILQMLPMCANTSYVSGTVHELSPLILIQTPKGVTLLPILQTGKLTQRGCNLGVAGRART